MDSVCDGRAAREGRKYYAASRFANSAKFFHAHCEDVEEENQAHWKPSVNSLYHAWRTKMRLLRETMKGIMSSSV